MRWLAGVLVIALIAAALPIGACCVSAAPSHACCRTQCMLATTTAIVKSPVALALSIAPVTIRVIAIVTQQSFCTIASPRALESTAPLPLRI